MGRLEVVDGDRLLDVGSPRQRALLVVLLLHRRAPVSSDRLIDSLWGEQAPPSAIKIVQGYVSNLRKVLGDGLLVTQAGGYALLAQPGEVDADRFEALAAEGRRALQQRNASEAAARLREALELWRGPPLAGFSYESFAQSEIARLQESRLTALEDRIDAELQMGEHQPLVAELEALVREHPLRERFVGQLMLALYRSGRQADALETYREARDKLVEELGLEPGPELRQLERAILEQDPALEPPSQAPASNSAAIKRRVRHGGLLIGAGGALLLAAIIAVAMSLARGGAVGAVPPNSVVVIDPGSDQVVGQVSVGSEPEGLAAGAGAVWVANTGDHSISEIDVGSRRVVRTLAFGYGVDGVAAGPGALWTLSSTSDLARRIDPTFGSVLATVKLTPFPGPFPSSPTAAAVAGRSAWFGNSADEVVRLAADDAASRIDVGNHPSGIAVGAGATWVADDFDDTVTRIDPTGASATIAVGRGPSGIAVGNGAVWVADTLDNELVRIDPATNSVTATIPVGSGPHGVAWADGSVWVANSGSGTVSRVDPRSDRVTATVAIGQSPQALVSAGRALWVSVQGRPPAITSGESPAGVLRVLRERPFQALDPPLQGPADVDEAQLFYATCAGLLTYPDRAGARGQQLVPDVAQALPTVSADGRTYTFTIRKGFRFSPPSNAPVTAATFKHTIERALSPRLQGWPIGFMGDIVGFAAYEAGRARHLAGVIARGDTLQIRLTAPAPDFPARIAVQSFCAVPDDTPDEAQTQPIPMAGPYYVTSSTPAQLVLARNPNYGGHRPRVPREIVYSFGTNFANAVNEVATGQSDYVSALQLPLDANIPGALFTRLERRYGTTSQAARTGHQRYFVNPTFALNSLVLNTKRPLFSSTRLRQAVNYAIDRQQLAALAGPFFGGQPINHYLPPGIPGSRPTAVYPLGAPDLAKARRLAAGVHAQATMYTCTLAACIQTSQLVRSELAAIGITVDITPMPMDALYTRLARRGEPWDIGWQNWQPDYADPSDYLTPLFDPSGADFGRFDEPGWIRAIRQARNLSGQRRLRTYGQLDDNLASRAAPIVAWSTDAARDFFGPRVGCETYQPIYGMDLGRLCLRR